MSRKRTTCSRRDVFYWIFGVSVDVEEVGVDDVEELVDKTGTTNGT